MTVLVLKLVLTPALIGLVSLAGRRWGSAVSGWLVGLPLTSGPVAFFLALDQGPGFAARASVGILAGVLSTVAFSVIYGWLAFAWPWPPALLVSWLGFFTVTWGLDLMPSYQPLPLYLTVCAALVAGLALLPRRPTKQSAVAMPWWDLPARMVISTAFVLLLTALAPVLGPHLSGLLAPFPLFTSILVAFAHGLEGPAPTARLLRGVLLGIFAFATFFLILASALVPLGIALAFVLASAGALSVQGASLFLLRARTENPN
jgi:hypothetical protein